MRSRTLLIGGLALLGAALATLLLAGRTAIHTSADGEAAPVPLAGAVVPVLVGMLLIRAVPTRLPALPPVVAGDRPRLARQTGALVGLALLFSMMVLFVPLGAAYPLVKVALLLGGAWLVRKMLPAADSGAGEQRRAMSRWAYWLAPVPAILAWGYLAEYSPLAGVRDLSGYREFDPVYLAVAALITFVTASVTEELFYRVVLQTRLEALLGRWPGIVTATLLFVAMHVHRVGDGPLWEILATIAVWNGGFGLFVGYLWSRYRNVWMLVIVHGAVNSLSLLPLLFE